MRNKSLPFTGLTIAAGNSLFPSSSISFTIFALLLPAIKKIIFSALLITGKVSDILSFIDKSGGETATDRCLFSLSYRVPGKRDAVWPSSPIPSNTRSNSGNLPFANLKAEIKSSSYFLAETSGLSSLVGIE